MTSTPIRILDPRAFANASVGQAPPLETLKGAVVAMLWNNRPRGDRILEGVAAELEKRHGARTVFRQKLRVGTGAPLEVIAGIAEEASAAVAGVGD
jgi:hypothetical protein